MLLQDPNIRTALIAQFNGSITTGTDSYAVDPAHALYARNVQYGKGLIGMDQVGTRLGHAQLVQIGSGDGAATSLANWYFIYASTQISIALYYCSAVGIRGWQQSTNILYTPFTAVTGAAGASIVSAGARFYSAFYDSTGRLGTTGGHVYGWNIGDDPLFAAPIMTAPVITQPSAGVITAGTHRVGFLTTTRNGYTGTLQPVTSAGVFNPVSFTADGAHNAVFTLTPGTLPSYLSTSPASLQVVMTTATNLNRWFAVPGAIATPLFSGANIVTFSITDDDLTATGTDVTSYLSNLTSTPGGTPPFNPSAIATYSSRMCYTMIDGAGIPGVAISEPNAYQKLTADQNIIYLDGNNKPIQCVTLHSGVLFIAAINGFYQTSDNGGTPVTWTPPSRVDGSVGIMSPTCLLVNPQSGFILVASTQGFYVFQGGVFPELPLSYYQSSDWQRINWAIPTQVQVAEDGLNRVFRVMAPLTCQITNVTNANPAVITTLQPHLFQTGLSVTLAGTGTSVDGSRIVTVLSPTTFSVPLASGGTATAGTAAPNAANCEMTWDYTDGYTPGTAQYCLRAFTSYRMGAIGNILNTTNGLTEVWFAPGASNPGPLIRQVISSDPTPYRDVNMSGSAAAIDCTYQTSNLPGAQDEEGATVHNYHGAHFRVSGNGSLSLLASGLDGNITLVPAISPLSLTQQEGKELLAKWFLRSEQETITVGTNAVDEYFILSIIRAYWGNANPQR